MIPYFGILYVDEGLIFGPLTIFELEERVFVFLDSSFCLLLNSLILET